MLGMTSAACQAARLPQPVNTAEPLSPTSGTQDLAPRKLISGGFRRTRPARANPPDDSAAARNPGLYHP
jgi:hypothetical protein